MSSSRAKPKRAQESARAQKRKRDHESIESLVSRIEQLDTAGDENFETFNSLPLSRPTQAGLEASHFRNTTEIQKNSIPLALKGRDILGAAKTGSGKTLTFLVPVLEKLYREKWSGDHGLAALILSPTRELAIQIFEVLRKIGRYHTFSAGLVIGGKSLQEERDRLARMNILVCTPGRILQHMDQAIDFDVGNLKVLVLDEADRIMDMGFQSTVDAIVEHLPKSRQTLLFSATQTKKVSDLARLSLKDPEYVSVHENANNATPSTLKQHYIVTPLQDKLDTLWSFIKSNTKSKTLVFLSSQKQVRFIYETFRSLQPGIPLIHLHGGQKQTTRLDITKRFSSSQYACLFATDVVARGLDFPAVDWVIQVDCPEDADTYIHRVGRTARFEREGRAVLFLEPTEEQGMLKRLEQKKIPIENIKVRQKKQQSIRNLLQERCFKDPEIKYLGQTAFRSYVRSIYLQPDKEIFKIQELPLKEFAESLGLPGAPNIKFQKGIDLKVIKNRPQAQASSDDESGEDIPKKKGAVRTKYDRMFERQNQDVLAPHREKLLHLKKTTQEGASDNEDFLAVKGRLSDLSSGDEQMETDGASLNNQKAVLHSSKGENIPIDSKRREKMVRSKKALLKYKDKGKKLIYDEDGNAREIYEFDDEDGFRRRGAPDELRDIFLNEETARVKADDIADKQLVKDKRKVKRDRVRARERAEASREDGEDSQIGGLPLVPFEDFFSGSDQEEESEVNRGGEGKVMPRAEKKWFQDDSDDESRPRKRQAKRLKDVENLEDLEALAQSLI